MKLFYGELERFGYILFVIETTEEKAKAALMKEYKKNYKARNGCSPSKEELDMVKDDMGAYEIELGKVEWN